MKHPLVKELDDRRRALGISTYRLAKLTGYSEASVWRWMCDGTRPSLNGFVDTANALGFDVVLVEREPGRKVK